MNTRNIEQGTLSADKITAPPTREKLLYAAQKILAEGGLEALNSNKIVEYAGVTPPTFYHYFSSKHEVLRELGTRMMQGQSEAVRADTGLKIKTAKDLRDACSRSVWQSYEATRTFMGSYALLTSLRAIPELMDVRLKAHEDISVLLANYFVEQRLSENFQDLKIRARLTLEICYAAIELLYETDGADEEAVLEYTIDAIVRVYDFF